MVTHHHADMTGIGLEEVFLSIFAMIFRVKELSEHKFPLDIQGIFI